MKVAVGSTNPVKIQAVREAFAKLWPNKKWEVVGMSVPSGVSDQPMSDAECIKGATKRAKRAIGLAKSDYGVGIEGGLQKIGTKWLDSGWIVVVDKKGRLGLGSSARIEVPQKLMKLIKSGIELGDAQDKLFNKKNSKQAGGYFHLMSDGAITRKQGYIHGVVFALTRFLHAELWV